MNKYIYSECAQEYWPSIKVIFAPSYNDAIEKLIERYSEQFYEDDYLPGISDIEDLQEYLNVEYSLVISDLVDIEEL